MTQEELQKLLTSFEKEVGHIKEWQIDQRNGALLGAHIRGKKSVDNKLGIHGASKQQRSKWAQSNGHIGGKASYEQKKGFHSDEVKEKYRKEWIETKKGMFDLDFQREKGLRHKREGVGFHGLSKEETIKNAKKGGQSASLVISKPILQFSKDGEFINEFRSLTEARTHLGKSNHSTISAAVNGKAKSAYGFIWKYKN